MSTQVEINGVTLLPIKDAAKVVSYSRDYVARLAREQKIVASQIGRQWFIDAVSLKNFAEISELELSVRKQQLSLERKREQVVKQEVSAVHRETKSKVKSVRLRAQVAAVLVLGFGLLAGGSIYTTATLFPSQASNLANLRGVTPSEFAAVEIPVENLEGVFLAAEPQATALFTTVTEQPLFIDEAQTRSMSIGNSEGIFLLAKDSEVRGANDIEALFSDEVDVRFVSESTGVITYSNTDTAEVKEFQFISLPAQSDQSAKSVKAVESNLEQNFSEDSL